MHDTSVLLSISMLISGREEMVKSLNSLLYFKNAFPCEIILVDTGCNAEQRALAEQYADKIIDFEWCNDFAAARNAGLKEARGEWFLYLDDDEWFDNPKEIIAFFQSGEYKEYNCASYVVRNYSNVQGTMYDDSYPSRMVKLEPGTMFVGKIHEYLTPFKLPKKNFSDFAHHYGYVYKSEDERKKHAYRNIAPLLEMRKQHPGDPRWMCQLAQEYFVISEYEKTIEAGKEALVEWNTLKEYVEYAPAHIGAVYAYILISLESLNTAEAFSEEEEWLKEALENPLIRMKEMEPTRAFFHLVGARLYSKLKEYEKCGEHFRKYLDIYKRLKNEREVVEVGTAAIVAGVFQEQLLYGAVLLCTEAFVRAEDYNLAEEAFYLLDWADKRLLKQLDFEGDVLKAFCSVPYHPLWVKMLQTLVSREDGMKEMYATFLVAEINYKQKKEQEKLLRLRRLVAELDFKHRYILCTRILWMEQNPDISSKEERKEGIKRLFAELFAEFPDEILEVKAEIWNVAERMELSMEPLLLQADYRRWKQCLTQWCQEAAVSDLQQWDARLADWKTQPDMRYDLFAVKCMEGYLYHHQEVAKSLEQLESLLWQYADSVLDLYRPYYKEFVFEKAPEILPDEMQLALRLKEVQMYREQENDLKALESVRRCLGVYSPLVRVMDSYAKMFRDEVSRKNQRAEAVQAEFGLIVNSLKETAKLRMERKQFQAAKEILLQIQQCVPGDVEVINLLNEIERNG